MKKHENAWLVAAVAVGWLALAGCRGMISDQPPIHLNPNMDDQARYDLQEANDFFADGRAMRPPVPGTVPSGLPGEHLGTGTVNGEWAEELPPELTLDADFLRRGRVSYEIHCTPCHDAAGTGQGTAVARGMLPPPTFHDDRLRAYVVGQFYEIVTNGVRNMPAYGHVAIEDRWAIAAHVRVLQISRGATLAQVPAAVAGERGWTE